MGIKNKKIEVMGIVAVKQFYRICDWPPSACQRPTESHPIKTDTAVTTSALYYGGTQFETRRDSSGLEGPPLFLFQVNPEILALL
jgi:hypothetical protein